MYATNTGGTWVHTLVDGAGSVQAGNFNSLVLDSNGKVHISYVDSSLHRLKYATNADRGWMNTTLDRVDVSFGTSIAMDGNGVVYISYHASSAGSLKCARNAGGAWEYCTVEDGTNVVGRHSSIAIERMDRNTYRPHISYYDSTGGDLKYAVYDSGAWSESVWDLSAIYAPAFNVGEYNSMILDADGMAHVSYYDATNDRLLLSINTGAFWNRVTIDIHAGYYTSLAKSASGVVFIAYYDNNDDDLKIAMNYNGDNLIDGGWGVATVDCAGDVGRYISLATGTQNTVHISYVDYTGEAVKHAQLRAEPSAPFGLSAVASGSDVTLSWSAPQMNNGCAITGYVLQRTDLAHSSVELIQVGNALSYVDADLSDGNYSYKVAAVNSLGTSIYSLKADVTVNTLVITAPGAPTNVAADPDDGIVVISWNAPLSDGGAPITNYTVYRGDVSGNLTALITLGVQLNYTDLGLENGHTYHYAVAALNSIGEGPRSMEVSAIPATVPSAPRNLTATLDGNDVILTWEAPEDDGGSPITNYTIYSGTVSGDLEYLYKVGELLTYTDTMSLPSTTFYYQVTATNAVGESASSNEVASDPDLPTSPILSGEADGDAVVLTWVAPSSSGSSAVTNYRVYRGNTSGALTMLTELGNVLTYQDEDVLVGATYYYKVTAVNGQGEGPFSNEVSVMVGSGPSAPRDLQATAGNGTVTLTWDAPEDDGGWEITGYKVYRGTAAGAETLLITLGDVTSYTDSSVVNGQTYYYRVSAVNDLGEGPQTASEDATPMADGGGGGDGDDDDGDGGDSTMLYVIIAVVVIAAIAAAAFIFLRKR
jgi:fibronectin type 3 domain-containing protein